MAIFVHPPLSYSSQGFLPPKGELPLDMTALPWSSQSFSSVIKFFAQNAFYFCELVGSCHKWDTETGGWNNTNTGPQKVHGSAAIIPFDDGRVVLSAGGPSVSDFHSTNSILNADGTWGEIVETAYEVRAQAGCVISDSDDVELVPFNVHFAGMICGGPSPF